MMNEVKPNAFTKGLIVTKLYGENYLIKAFIKAAAGRSNLNAKTFTELNTDCEHQEQVYGMTNTYIMDTKVIIDIRLPLQVHITYDGSPSKFIKNFVSLKLTHTSQKETELPYNN